MARAMEIRDLGRLNRPVPVFGGVLSNLHALHALLDAVRHLGTPPAMICTGDVAAYCADPEACAALIRETGIAVLAGNCEKQLAAEAGDCGCGFEEGSACDLLAPGWYAYVDARILPESRAWMATCPDRILFTQGGRRFAVIHGGATEISRFLFETSPEPAFRTEIAALRDQVGPFDAVLAGHSGIPFIRRFDAVDWINPGALGLPPHDGDPRTAYAILRDGIPEFHRLSYDHRAAARAMKEAGLTQGYHETLRTGYWPSDDVLPAGQRRNRP